MGVEKSTVVATAGDKPDCAPLGLLESAVLDYEKNTGMSALNYRGLQKRSTLKDKLDAANLDLHWWDNHAHECSRRLNRVVTDLSIKCGF